MNNETISMYAEIPQDLYNRLAEVVLAGNGSLSEFVEVAIAKALEVQDEG